MALTFNAIAAVPHDAALAVAPFISKDETRYYLSGVNVASGDGNSVLCVATDGRRMGIQRADGICLKAATVRVPAALKTDRVIWLVIYGKGGSATDGSVGLVAAETAEEALSTPIEEALAAFADSLIDAEYPDWRRVVPSKPDGKTAGFNADYVRAFARKKGDALSISNFDPAAPNIVLRPNDPDFFGVLMPMKVDNAKVPAWLDRVTP